LTDDQGEARPEHPAAAAVARYLNGRDAPSANVPDAIRARGYDATVGYLRLIEKQRRQ